MRRPTSILLLLFAGFRAEAAAAQDSAVGSPETATAAAEDAFGEQVGIERIGLWLGL